MRGVTLLLLSLLLAQACLAAARASPSSDYDWEEENGFDSVVSLDVEVDENDDDAVEDEESEDAPMVNAAGGADRTAGLRSLMMEMGIIKPKTREETFTNLQTRLGLSDTTVATTASSDSNNTVTNTASAYQQEKATKIKAVVAKLDEMIANLTNVDTKEQTDMKATLLSHEEEIHNLTTQIQTDQQTLTNKTTELTQKITVRKEILLLIQQVMCEIFPCHPDCNPPPSCNGTTTVPATTAAAAVAATTTAAAAPVATTTAAAAATTAAPVAATTTAKPAAPVVAATTTAAPVVAATTTAAPVVAGTTAAPHVVATTAAPNVEATTAAAAAPVATTAAAAPVVAATTAAPHVEATTAKPAAPVVATTAAAAPVVAATTAAPHVEATTAAPVAATTAAPVVAGTTAAPHVEVTTAAPVVAGTTAAPHVEATTAAPVAATTTAAPIAETTAKAVSKPPVPSLPPLRIRPFIVPPETRCKPGLSESCAYPSCLAIKESSFCAMSNTTCPDGVYWIDPEKPIQQQTIEQEQVHTSQPFQVYCDMQNDGGGWTLLLTIAPKGQASPTLQDWPSTFDRQSGDVKLTGMWKGSLKPFTDVREEVGSGRVTVYGKGLTEAQLNTVRLQYAWAERPKVDCKTRPSCRSDYLAWNEEQDIVGCCVNLDKPSQGFVEPDEMVGWQLNSRNFPCYGGQGKQVNQAAPRLGSSPCSDNSDPDGTSWTRLWLR